MKKSFRFLAWTALFSGLHTACAHPVPNDIATVRIVSLDEGNRHSDILRQGSGAVIHGSNDGAGNQLVLTARHVIIGATSNHVPENGTFIISSWKGRRLGIAHIYACNTSNSPSNMKKDIDEDNSVESIVYHDSCLLKVDQPSKEYRSMPGYRIDMLADRKGAAHKGPLVICQPENSEDPGWGRGMSGGPLLNMDDPSDPKIVGVSSVVTSFNASSNCAYFAPITRDIWEEALHNNAYRGIRKLSEPGHWRVEGFLHGDPTGISTSHGIVNMQRMP